MAIHVAAPETRALYYVMRLLLAFLVLLQLDPVIGAALCLHREDAASEECAMPESSRSTERTLAPGGSHVDGSCAFAKLCIPPAPAVVELGQVLLFTPPLDNDPARAKPLAGPRGVLTPPFHPPRV